MADFLTAVSTKKTNDSQPPIARVQSLNIHETVHVDSPQSVLKALKNQPSPQTLKGLLKYLTFQDSSLLLPDPVNANIAYQLVNDTIPNYWRTLKGSDQATWIVQILRNPTGLGHIITRLRTLIADNRSKKGSDGSRNIIEHIEDIFDLLDRILCEDVTSVRILQDILAFGRNNVQKKIIWREYLAQVATGRMLSIAAEAEDILKKSDSNRTSNWIANGNAFAAWLGRNLSALIKNNNKKEEYLPAIVEFCSKALGLGYTDNIISSFMPGLLDSKYIGRFANLIPKLRNFEQQKYLNGAIAFTVKQYFSSTVINKDDVPVSASKTVSDVASLFHNLIKDNHVLKEHLLSALTRSILPSLDESLAARRSMIAALAQDEEKLHILLDNAVIMFGDSVYVRHTPILQQEVLAQNLALCCGYVYRSQPMSLTMTAKSSYHINGMSHRMGATSERARFLGIAVGIAISKMVDKPDLQLKFDLEGPEAEEARWYEHLTAVDDRIGDMSSLGTQDAIAAPVKKVQQKPKSALKPAISPMISDIQGPRIVEVLSDSEDDDDLVPYEKPDSDPEDDGDDPETINRNKPTAPVYIRDLIAGLKDQENYDRHELALSTAATLIRRKANFGTEVTDHLEELASILTGLQDNLELEHFSQHKQQALIAVLLAKPAQMAQWFARCFFSGDYSLSQRIAILTTLGLGARELAGLKDSTTEDLIPAGSSFPSKQLPPHLHQIYAQNSTATSVAKISSHMAREMLSPIASQAADTLSGPNILKVRTFSSRMEVEKKRHKPIPNALAQIVADNFFFPLTGRWWIQVRVSSDSIYTSTHLLPPFLQTLSLLLNASGPNTLALPQMTREYWDLLLSVRGLAVKEKNVLGAVLFGFLMLLQMNENKERLATEQGRELMETQAWVKMVFDGLGAGSEEDERVRALAAGVVVRCQEVVEKYQRRMVGALMDY